MIKSFKLDNIKNISRQEVALINALYEYLPATDVREKIHVGIRKILIKHLGQDIRYYLSSVERRSYRDFLATLPEFPILASLGLAPLEKKGVAFFDHNVAHLMISKLLGGGSDAAVDELRPLTETEQGVLQYLIMQVLSQVYKMAGRRPRVHFRFEGFSFDPASVEKFMPVRESVCVLTVEVSLFDQAGFVRLVFPDPFLEEALHQTGNAGELPEERIYFAKRIERWGFLKMSAWAEAGKSLISPAEMKDLEEGDVILFDEAYVKLKDRTLEGDLVVHFGGAEGGVKSKILEIDKKNVKCMFLNTVK